MHKVSDEAGDSSCEESHIGEEGKGVCVEGVKGMHTQPFPVDSSCSGDGLVEETAKQEGAEEDKSWRVVVA